MGMADRRQPALVVDRDGGARRAAGGFHPANGLVSLASMGHRHWLFSGSRPLGTRRWTLTQGHVLGLVGNLVVRRHSRSRGTPAVVRNGAGSRVFRLFRRAPKLHPFLPFSSEQYLL